MDNADIICGKCKVEMKVNKVEQGQFEFICPKCNTIKILEKKDLETLKKLNVKKVSIEL